MKIDERVKIIHDTSYQTVIEVNMPLRFYWDLEGNFDGIEFGDGKPISKKELIPVSRILMELNKRL